MLSKYQFLQSAGAEGPEKRFALWLSQTRFLREAQQGSPSNPSLSKLELPGSLQTEDFKFGSNAPPVMGWPSLSAGLLPGSTSGGYTEL